MARVVDYASLSQALQDWYARSDVGGFVDYFIQSAEDRIYNDIFALNQGRGVQPMESPIAQAIDANGQLALSTLPSYLGIKSLRVTVGSNVQELQRVNDEFIYTQFPLRAASGPPQYVARDGQNFVFGPFPDSTYALTGTYWMRAAPLSASNTSTWMITSMCSTLQAACASAVAKFLKDPDRASTWDAMYAQQLQAFIDASKAEEQSGSALCMVPG